MSNPKEECFSTSRHTLDIDFNLLATLIFLFLYLELLLYYAVVCSDTSAVGETHMCPIYTYLLYFITTLSCLTAVMNFNYLL